MLVNIDKFEPNPILVNNNKQKTYIYLDKVPRELKATIEGGGKHKGLQGHFQDGPTKKLST
jgi:hypothetical protein